MTARVFGPVPSRRLGRSLGIDPVPGKTCDWSCVYCQLGRTPRRTLARRDWFPPGEILAEAREALARHGTSEIDWITFVGSGEPTLCASLGSLIRGVKRLSRLPVAVITNGSLLGRPEVRAELVPADAAMPTLDAGSPALFRRMNRPHPGLRYEDHVEGLAEFRREFRGDLWVEVMLVRGVNDSVEGLEGIARALERVRPDRVHLNVPVRPPAEPWVAAPTEQALARAASMLGAEPVSSGPGSFSMASDAEPVQALVGIISRHPMRHSELLATIAEQVPGRDPEELVEELRARGSVREVERLGTRFWCAAH